MALSCVAMFLWAMANCRDPLRQPFASTSIWNTPIGSNALLKPARLFSGSPRRPLPPRFHCDQDWFVTTQASDPLVAVHAGYFANCSVQGPVVGKMQLPHAFVTDCGPNNNAAAILQPDGRTLLQFQPIYRGEAGGPVMGWFKPNNGTGPLIPGAGDTCHGQDCDIRGNGTSGAHGGSQLSSLGGTVRVGELLPNTGPIAHALKLELVASQYFWWQANVTNYSTCWRWPARTCDGYAPQRYGGTDPDLQPGSLLAVDAVSAKQLQRNVSTVPGRKLLAALRDYGGYIVDDIGSAREGAAFCAEHDVIAEVKRHYGWDIRYSDAAGNALPAINATNNASAFYWDLVAIFRALSIVVNNRPQSIGGGGHSRVPPPPPLCPAGH